MAGSHIKSSAAAVPCVDARPKTKGEGKIYVYRFLQQQNLSGYNIIIISK